MSYLTSIFLGVSLAAIPGPIFFELIRRTLTKGFWSGALLSVGEFLANLVILILTFYGIQQFLEITWLKAALFLIGGGLLIYIGLLAFKITKEDINKSSKNKNSGKNSIFVGFALAITSPLAIAVWISVGGSYLVQYLSGFVAFSHMIAIAFGVMLFFFVLASVVYYIKDKISAKYIIFVSRIFGIVLIVYGLTAFYKLFELLR
jgi:threonine/homoserine/homoserine lactone efflux protein